MITDEISKLEQKIEELEPFFKEYNTLSRDLEILKKKQRELKLKDKCCFDIPWYGTCGIRDKKDAVIQIVYSDTVRGFCEKHSKERCRCGKQAIKACSNAGSLVCGAPLCESCRCPSHGGW